MPLKKDIVDILGTALFTAKCRGAGIRVSRPTYDDGIDLVLYPEAFGAAGLISHPLQLKSFGKCSFFTGPKYVNIRGLWIAYIWYVESFLEPVWTAQQNQFIRPRFFVMPYSQAETIVTARGWVRARGRYVRTRHSGTLEDALTPFEITDFDALRGLLWPPA